LTRQFRLLLAAFLLSFPFRVVASEEAASRPKITAILMVRLSVTDTSEARQFYSTVLDAPEYGCHWCETDTLQLMRLASGQIVTFVQLKSGQPSGHVESIVFAIDDADAMRKYLEANKIKIEASAKEGATAGKKRSGIPAPTPSTTHSRFLRVRDPEGHPIEFWQAPQTLLSDSHTNDLRIIHVGIIVNDVAAEDHFYKDILGFRMYWHGGRKDGKDDWVALQVPDGTDWVEYMLNIPPGANQRTIGVASHIGLGVQDIEATQARLLGDRVALKEEPQLGLDGRWQLNVYDSDQTRVEFMEFKPKAKPCCSEFTGTHPGPQ
jgi:catechol 2,3-dioxygenase-like lactoylglutathione lyase family enzyme